MPWIDACSATDIPAEDVIRFDHGARTFIIVRDHEDGYWCADGLCTHEDIHLCDGMVVECTIECPKHSSIFNVTTGEVRDAPRLQQPAHLPDQGRGRARLRGAFEMGFQLAACAEMLWCDRPIAWRASS